MRKSEEHQVGVAIVELDDAHDELAALSDSEDQPHLERALRSVQAVRDRLAEQLADPAGLPIAEAAEYLEVSEPTGRSWLKVELLAAVPQSKPLQVERETLRQVHRVLGELRSRGQDRDWLQALVDSLHDRVDRARPEIQRGLSELKQGQLEPA